jgi:hypothetical protein
MAIFALFISLLLGLGLQVSNEPTQARNPNPLAPSLPELTRTEEQKIERIINRFIDADSGQLPSTEVREAVNDFKNLKAEAIPALIQGLNRAAKIDHSCPAVTIAAKLARMLKASRDPMLLDFARENIGAGITQSRHMVVIKDLRLRCTLRKRYLAEHGLESYEPFVEPAQPVIIRPGQNELRNQPTNQLVYATMQESGRRLRAILKELARRDGEMALDGLASAALTTEKEDQEFARKLLREKMARLDNAELTGKLTSKIPEIRAAAAQVAADKGLETVPKVIAMLQDPFPNVQKAAHEALVRLAKGIDFGPKADASPKEREQAKQLWLEWFKIQGSSKP